MNSNANLNEQLELAARICTLEEIDTGDALRLAQLVRELDDHIFTSGPLPDIWKQTKKET